MERERGRLTGSRALVVLAFFLAGCSAGASSSRDRAQNDLPSRVAPFERYRGLSGFEVVRLLGHPDFERRDLDAAIWQYRGGVCILDLFLYEEEGVLRVLHTEMHHARTGRPCTDKLPDGRPTEIAASGGGPATAS